MTDAIDDDVVIRTATAADAGEIANIYNHYVTDTIVTFEEVPISADEMARRIAEVVTDQIPWLVAIERGPVVGYAYASKWKRRIGYRTSVETTVYLAEGHGGKGIGSKLYTELFSIIEAKGFHSAIGGIALPNDASVALHEKFAMKRVALFREVGIKFGQWIDVGYWQRLMNSNQTDRK
jgi:phosphinothricin acetyltransferase